MTQYELIKTYCAEFGSILPAKMYGEVYRETMCGSELSKRCRELRAKGVLRSEQEGRFERFYLNRVQAFEAVSPIFLHKDACCYSFQVFGTHGSDCQLKQPVKEISKLF